jgi:hypothetical protein
MTWFNTIWQGDANALTLASFAAATAPPFLCNLTGREILHVREVAERLGRLLDRPPCFTGQERPTALLSNASRAFAKLGTPAVDAETLIHWVAHWLKCGGCTLNRPTHYESREGRF